MNLYECILKCVIMVSACTCISVVVWKGLGR